MSNFQTRYKGKPFGFANIDESRYIRAEKHSDRRKAERTKTFNDNRNILYNPMNSPLPEEPKISAAVENRMARLLKWKMERDRRKKLEQAKKKRPFVVGKVHHKVYSPIIKDVHITSITASKKVFKSNVPTVPLIPQKRITRATEKRLMHKAQLNKINNVPTKADHPMKNKHSNLSKKQEQSFASANYKFKPPENLKRLPLFGRVTNSISDCFNESLMSFARVSRVSRKSCSSNLPAESINSTVLNTSYTIEKKQDDNTEDDNIEEDSIEPIVLKLSSDDENESNSCSRHTSRRNKNNADTSNDVSKKDKETNKKFNDTKKNTKFNDSKKIEKFNDSKKSEKFNDSRKSEKFNDSKKNEKFNDSKKNTKFNDSKKIEKFNDSRKSEKFNDSKKSEKFNDSRKSEKLNDSKKNEKFNDSKRNTKFNDSKRNTKFNESKRNTKFNDSKKIEKFNDSKKSEKFNDSQTSEKFDDSKKNEKFNDSKKSEKFKDSKKSEKLNNYKRNKDNQKLNISHKDNESNNIVNDISEESQPSNKDKSIKSDFSSESTFLPPYVVSSRGENSARNYIPTKELVMKNLNTSDEEEERTAQYFELLLNKEIDRQSQLCEKWTKIKEESEISEDAQYQINQAIGQTNLLMNKKFVKFRNLIFDCMTGKGEMVVTCNDLQGFWDMMYIEVEDCNLRFEKLEQLRSRGWEEEEVITVNKPCTRKKVAATKKTVSTKPSGIRAFLAKRKQNLVERTQGGEATENLGISNNEVLSSKYENNENSPNLKCKSRASNKTRSSLLRKLQFSETKTLKSPLTMIKISQMCKTPEIQLDDTISYINSHQTPSRSILKQSKYSNQIESSIKSAQKVNFNDIVINKGTVDDEAQRKKNLAAVLVKIDSPNLDCVSDETPIHAEKKLIFNDESFEESPNIFDVSRNSDSKKHANINMSTQKTIPTIITEAETSLNKSVLNCRSRTPSPSNKLTRQDAFCEDEGSCSFNISVSTPFKEVVDNTNLNESKQKLQKHFSINKKEETAELNDNIKVLRNRSIISGNTPIQKRRYTKNQSTNVQELEYKENKTPTKAKSKNLDNDSTKVDTLVNSEVDLYDAIRGMSLEESYGRRRSSRRSVKFSEKECSGCVEKLTFSVTPHVRRIKAQFTEKKRTVITKESIETTDKLPERVRRSKSKKV